MKTKVLSSIKMSFKSIVHDLKEMKASICCGSTREVEGEDSRRGSELDIAPESVEQGKWANLPLDLLLDIIRRTGWTQSGWPPRINYVCCASVCRSWREIVKEEIIRSPDECKRLTFPISLKLPGPRNKPNHCVITRDRSTFTYRLYVGFLASEHDDRLLLTAKRIGTTTSREYMISLAEDDFSEDSSAYFGKVKCSLLGNSFIIYDNLYEPPITNAVQRISWEYQRFNDKQVLPRLPAYDYRVSTISYKFHVLCTKGGQMHCAMLSIPPSSTRKGGNVPISKSFPRRVHKKSRSLEIMKGNPAAWFEEPLDHKNRPSWHEELHCWCLNVEGRVTAASVKNLQLVVADDPLPKTPAAERRKVLHFQKIGSDTFSMEYQYPLSIFQAYAICLSSFDSKNLHVNE